jgi:hypothetical protein
LGIKPDKAVLGPLKVILVWKIGPEVAAAALLPKQSAASDHLSERSHVGHFGSLPGPCQGGRFGQNPAEAFLRFFQ